MCLRASVAAATLVTTTALAERFYWLPLVGLLVAIGLCAGLLTRVLAGGALLSIFAAIASELTTPEWAAAPSLAAVALGLAGAGAYSADARLYGLRKISLPDEDDTIV